MPTPKLNTAAAKPAKKPRAPRKAATSTAKPVPDIDAQRRQMQGADGPTADPYAVTAWASEEGLGSLHTLDLPSGQRALCQRPGAEGLMIAGLLDDLDVLAPQVKAARTGSPAAQRVASIRANAAKNDPKAMQEAIKLMNRVAVHVVVKPELTDEPDDPQHKEMGKIYPSSVSLEDKMFLFNWAVGGTRDIARFREQHTELVAGMDTGEDVAQASE